DDAERLAPLDLELPTLPTRRLDHRLEERAATAHSLALVYLMGPASELQKPDPILHVVLVGVGLSLEVPHHRPLLPAPLGGLTVEEGVVDPALELVDVHGVEGSWSR